jgi:hypothetical protein
MTSEQVLEVPMCRQIFDGERPFASRVAYDAVASAIALYHDAAASEVAQQLDPEVLGLPRQVTGLPASAASDSPDSSS